MKKKKIELNHIPYVGSVILDASKCHLLNFHYQYMLPMYGIENVHCTMTDTDSCLYLVRCEDIYEDMKHNLKYFDTSNYPKTHFLHSEHAVRKMGTIKDETAAVGPITCFVGLKSKCYAYMTETHTSIKKAKGLKSTIVKSLTFKDYTDALHIAPLNHHSYCGIRSIKNQLYTVKGKKVGLNCFDDKRWICDRGIDTYAYGHWRIRSRIHLFDS